ncbi:protein NONRESPONDING TO OXYLIPINS 2, mitochondrial [Amaranthus tricolor]|uniref:protein NONRESPONDING TO OXYLIPINS 2, mitochondrial n=1 Tax=Amaranthus tricolor TaxID=29722 RepID=UPI00258E7963|nr:protein NONRESPONDING TO OXYLIPINS 2, mitochondrial [Amaranthus tricolor]
MASRYRSFSRPAINILKSTFAQKSTSNSIPSFRSSSSSPKFPRVFRQMGAIHSLLPLHSAVSSARLTSCLGIDPISSRSLSQELGLSVPR